MGKRRDRGGEDGRERGERGRDEKSLREEKNDSKVMGKLFSRKWRIFTYLAS